MHTHLKLGFFLALAIGLLANAAGAWEKVEHLPLRDDGDKRSLLQMLDRQVNHLSALPNKSYRMGQLTVSRERLLATAKELRLLVLKYHGRPEFGLRVRERFLIYRVSNPARRGKTLFTGYYDPVIPVSETPSKRFRYPLYGAPRDLRHTSGDDFYRVAKGAKTPYYTRRQIDGDGVLGNKGLEIAWTEDFVSLYYLMVQGSGVAVYPDGRKCRIRFAASNGHPYRSAAQACMNDGKCPGGYEKNLAWFRANPVDAKKYFFLNPRYIFFAIEQAPATGVQDIPLTAYRTVATDKKRYPAASLALVKIPLPHLDANGTVTHSTVSLLVGDCDTGSAIKGTGRADFYFGSGPQMEKLAGSTHGWGEMYYLLVK